MSEATVDIRVDLVLDHGIEEVDEAAVTSRIAEREISALRDARALDGALRIGGAEIADELFFAVQRLCFEGATALLTHGAVFDYAYFSSNENARFTTNGDTVVLSGSDVPESMLPRWDLIRALYACGARWITTLEEVGRMPEVNHLRPFATAAQSALAVAGLA